MKKHKKAKTHPQGLSLLKSSALRWPPVRSSSIRLPQPYVVSVVHRVSRQNAPHTHEEPLYYNDGSTLIGDSLQSKGCTLNGKVLPSDEWCRNDPDEYVQERISLPLDLTKETDSTEVVCW